MQDAIGKIIDKLLTTSQPRTDQGRYKPEGRTAHLHMRTHPQLMAALQAQADDHQITVTSYVETILRAVLGYPPIDVRSRRRKLSARELQALHDQLADYVRTMDDQIGGTAG